MVANLKFPVCRVRPSRLYGFKLPMKAGITAFVANCYNLSRDVTPDEKMMVKHTILFSLYAVNRTTLQRHQIVQQDFRS